jgi:hemerythrin superfamily protein
MPTRSAKAKARVREPATAPSRRASPRSAARAAAAPARAGARVAALTRAQTVPGDALDLLVLEHRDAEAMFDQFETVDDAAQQLQVARRICLALTIHTMIEEALVYPVARQALGEDGADLLDEAEVEHASAKILIAEIEAMTPRDPLFKAKVTVLGEYVKHHVQEEENQLFPRLRACDLDFYALGAELVEHKVALLIVQRATVPAGASRGRAKPPRAKARSKR